MSSNEHEEEGTPDSAEDSNDSEGGSAADRAARDFRHESLEDAASIIRYLEALQKGFESGALTFRDKGGEIGLRPHGLLKLQLRASRKGARNKVSLEIGWKDEGEAKDDNGKLEIGV